MTIVHLQERLAHLTRSLRSAPVSARTERAEETGWIHEGSAYQDEVTMPEDFKSFLDERDELVAQIEHLPATVDPIEEDHRTAKKGHLNLVVLDAWEDGLLSDEYIQNYMHEFRKCQYCVRVYESYASLKARNS